MKNQHLSILFVIKLNKQNKKGLCPLNLRITYQKKRKEIASGLFVDSKNWDSKLQKVKLSIFEENQINLQLAIISNDIKKAHLQLLMTGDSFGAEDILNNYIGEPMAKEIGVVEYFQKFLINKKKLVGIDIQLSTWKKFHYTHQHIKDFIIWKHGKRDYALSKLKFHFLHDFEFYLKTEKRHVQVTINKTIQRFRKPIKIAVAEGILVKDPFLLYLPGRVKKHIVFLTVDELGKVESFKFSQPRLQLVKDLFIFCCYTGLAYIEMSNLKKEEIVRGFDGNDWIQMKRKKTDKMISVPLLPKAKLILDKYDNLGNFALPKFSNQKINSYLKEIAAIVGINKSITHHMARKTFASTILLYNDVPMEIVCELLGHSSIKITQEYYGKIVQKKVGSEMKKLGEKLSQ